MKFGHIQVPGAVYAYATLGAVSGASLLSLYGVMLTFVLRTLPATNHAGVGPCNPKSTDATAYKLKQAMIGLLTFTVLPLFIVAVIIGASTKGTLRAEIFLFLFAGLSALGVISTSLAYTQVDEVQADTRGNKKAVEGALIGTAVATVALGLAAVGLWYKQRKVLAADLKTATQAARRGDWAAAANPFVQERTIKALQRGRKTLAADVAAA